MITFITAYAPYHDDLVARAVASVDAQTVPCAHVLYRDSECRGAGWARNQAVETAQTPFIAFLDADDWVTPDFAFKTLLAYDDGRYVYTDHWQGETYVSAPDCAWTNHTWHPITALLPTVWFRAVGGFDETLPGGEDTDLFMKLIASGCCGKRLAEALFHYGEEGRRSDAFVSSPDYGSIIDTFLEKYGGKQMGCCGGIPASMDIPAGAPQEGDVLAQALWAGNRTELGRATGRPYRSGNNKVLWVDPRDVAASPNLFRPSQQNAPSVPSPSRAEVLAALALAVAE